MQNFTLTDKEEETLGNMIVHALNLKPRKDFHPVRFDLGAGYGTKTALGVGRVILGMIEEIKKQR